MHRGRLILAWLLVILFVGLSFNAYACVLPIFSGKASAMAGGCANPEDQPAHQFCDTFKTLGVHAASEAPKIFDSHVISWEHSAVLPFLATQLRTTRGFVDFPAAPPRDIIISTTVLRI
jgi:hypothetical protein